MIYLWWKSSRLDNCKQLIGYRHYVSIHLDFCISNNNNNNPIVRAGRWYKEILYIKIFLFFYKPIHRVYKKKSFSLIFRYCIAENL